MHASRHISMEYVRSVRLAVAPARPPGQCVIATLRHRDFALLWTAGLISVAGGFALTRLSGDVADTTARSLV
jgi:hypothetical protein